MTKVHPVILPSFFFRNKIVWLILAVLLCGTVWAWYFSKEINDNRLREHFNFRAEILRSSIERRLFEYQAVLSSGAALFDANEYVDRNHWRVFVESLQIDLFFPGIQAMGVSMMIRPQDLSRHIASVRAEGYPQYTVKPEGERDLYSSIVYIEPFQGRNLRAFGYDMYSEPVRNAAMQYARDFNTVSISGKVRLLQETDTDIQNGFLMYFPVFRKGMPHQTVQERRDALELYVYFPFRIKDLMKKIVRDSTLGLGLEIFDGDTPNDDTFFYSSEDRSVPRYGKSSFQPLLSSVVPLDMGGHRWTLYFYTQPGFTSVFDTNSPIIIAVAGFVLDFLIFGLLVLLFNRHARVKRLAEEMTDELREKDKDLRQFTEILAHHLQEPVRLQLGYAARLEAYLKTRDFGPEPEQALYYIKRGAERLRLLLHDVQAYLALSQSVWVPQLCDANRALNLALVQLRSRINATQAIIQSSELSVAVIDGDRLTDVFLALIDNSLSHGRKDEPLVIEIRAVQDGDTIVFSVEDNGIGIPVEYQERVFNVFERLSPELSPPGTGIGLAIVRKTIEAAGGKVWIETSGTGGTRVVFTLPNGQDVKP